MNRSGMAPSGWVYWATRNWEQFFRIPIYKFISKKKVLPLPESQEQFNFPDSPMSVIYYRQIQAACATWFRRGEVEEPDSLEQFIFLLEVTYKKLNPGTTVALQNTWSKWNSDLGGGSGNGRSRAHMVGGIFGPPKLLPTPHTFENI